MAALGCPCRLTPLGAGPWWGWKRRCVRLTGVTSDLERKPNGRAVGDPVLWVQGRTGQKLQGLPGGSVVKNPPAMQETGFDPWAGKIPWRRAWQPTPVFLPGESHGQRSLAGYSPGRCKESDTTERLTHTRCRVPHQLLWDHHVPPSSPQPCIRQDHSPCVASEVLEAQRC